MIDLDYGYYHIERTWRMVRGDDAALDEMDITADGFWRSFGAIVFAMPAMFFSWVSDARYLAFNGVELSMGQLVISYAVLELMLWILPILILAFVLKPMQLAHRFTHLVIVRNWFSVPIYYLFAVLALPSLVIAGWETPGLLQLTIIFVMVWIQVRLTRMALQCEPWIASILIVGEFLIAIFAFLYFQEALGIVYPDNAG